LRHQLFTVLQDLNHITHLYPTHQLSLATQKLFKYSLFSTNEMGQSYLFLGVKILICLQTYFPCQRAPVSSTSVVEHPPMSQNIKGSTLRPTPFFKAHTACTRHSKPPGMFNIGIRP